ncbi:hypothetical protein [Phenylobacterium sp.]|uniref:hypothetical protein n=1 Tax=Phenylobacterium sp. TaxID=1871053 RepID=UPI0039839A4A
MPLPSPAARFDAVPAKPACKAQSEDPAGLGYAGAALALARTFRLAVWSDEGLPTIVGTVRVPIRFDLDDVAKP